MMAADAHSAVDTVLTGLAVALMLGLFLAPFVLYPAKVALSQRRRVKRLLDARIEELRAGVERMGTPYHMMQLGAALLEAGAHEEAQQWLERAYERDPHSLDNRYQLGRCYFLRRAYRQAGQVLEEVIRQRPTFAYGDAFFLYARALEEGGEEPAAMDAYERFLRYYPNHPEATWRFAMILDRAGRRDRAAELLRQMVAAVEAGPSFQRQRQRQWVRKARQWLASQAVA